MRSDSFCDVYSYSPLLLAMQGHALTRVTGAGFHSGRARLMTNYHPTAQHKDEPGNSVKDAWDFSEGR
jgi:hypothetical protein